MGSFPADGDGWPVGTATVLWAKADGDVARGRETSVLDEHLEALFGPLPQTYSVSFAESLLQGLPLSGLPCGHRRLASRPRRYRIFALWGVGPGGARV